MGGAEEAAARSFPPGGPVAGVFDELDDVVVEVVRVVVVVVVEGPDVVVVDSVLFSVNGGEVSIF